MAWKPDYITTTELKAYERIDDALDDTELAVAIGAASRAIDKHTNRQFGLVAAAEERDYTDKLWYDDERCWWVVTIDDLMTTTGFVFEIDGDAVTDYTLMPRNAAAEGRPWTRLAIARTSAVQPTGYTPEILVTGRWGWTTVPVPVTMAARLQSARFAIRRDSPYGVAGSPEAGNELRLLAKLDPDVGISLTDYVRPRRAA